MTADESSSSTQRLIAAAARLYWIPFLPTAAVWAGVTIAFLYFSDLCYDDHETERPYKDSGFLASFDWSNTDGGDFQKWLNEGYAIGHAFLLLVFALVSGRDRLTLLRRMLLVSLVSQVLFQLQLLSTRLPDPNPHNIGRRWRYVQMPVQYTFGALFVQFYTGSWAARFLSWLVALGGIFILVPTHYLYTVDVQTGIITGLTVFLVFHWHVRTTHAIQKNWLLSWYELDFLRWHTVLVEANADLIGRDESRARAASLDTVKFVGRLASGQCPLDALNGGGGSAAAGAPRYGYAAGYRPAAVVAAGPGGAEAEEARRNEDIIAASLAPPLISANEFASVGNTNTHSTSPEEGATTSSAETTANNRTQNNQQGSASALLIDNSSLGSRPAYAAGGLGGFTRHGYSENDPESDYLMEYFRCPPFAVDMATRSLVDILDQIEAKYYRLPDGSASLANPNALGVVPIAEAAVVAIRGPTTAGGSSSNSNPSPNVTAVYTPRKDDDGTIKEIVVDSEKDKEDKDGSGRSGSATDGSDGGGSGANKNNKDKRVSGMGGDAATTEGQICCGITVSSSSDPETAAAERKNWVKRSIIIFVVTFGTFGLGGALATANEIPIHIADANRPIGIPLPWDFCHEYLPKVPASTPDILMYPLVGVAFAYVFFSRHRWVLLRRTALWYGLCMGLRCLTVPATFLPDPSPNCRLPEHPPGTTCGDLIFSGHTLTFCATVSVLWKYCDSLVVRVLGSLYALAGVMSIICSHLHYGRDVLTALIVAFACYHLIHRALIHRVDVYLKHAWLRYFEFDYFCILVEDRQLARMGLTRRCIWTSGGFGETLAQIADAWHRRQARKNAEKAPLLSS